MVNGFSKGYFKSSRGIRQGDPLSPMLFVLVVEALNEKARRTGLFTGFAIDDSGLEVTHLQFADNSIIFCNASLDEVNNLKLILKWFELLSGLRIKYGKCEFIGVRLASSQVATLANAFGCKFGKLPSNYLGIPLCLGIPKSSM